MCDLCSHLLITYHSIIHVQYVIPISVLLSILVVYLITNVNVMCGLFIGNYWYLEYKKVHYSQKYQGKYILENVKGDNR